MVMTLQDKVNEFNRRINENPDLISGPAEKLFDAETDFLIASTLAESYSLCGMKVLPPSMGVIMLLTCVNSPFVTGLETASLKDVIECLFIIKYRSKIGSYILKKKETAIVLANLEHEARDNPVIYGIYMDRIMNGKVNEYDRLLVEFSEGLTGISVAESVMEIGRYLGKPLKKNSKSRITTGWLAIFRRFLVGIFISSSGK